ncbi:cobyrinic acid A,C-diamide synthase [Trichinella spiralis]|uniref:cobyrinic acid A,C-diamide synthase n=1 Tax=Trichinella spiralis TaxID=6334 RepID=UPI0001EFB616|nr:cobyrinic acid A,C-diamide synthase [Trichinella spiralis]
MKLIDKRKFQINLRQEWNEIETVFVLSLGDLNAATFASLHFGTGDSTPNLLAQF